MARADKASVLTGHVQSLLALVRESGDAAEASSPLFDIATGAARLRAAAWGQELLQPGDAEGDFAFIDAAIGDSGAALEGRLPAFDVAAGAARLLEAARDQGLLSSVPRGAHKGTHAQPILHDRYRCLHRLGAGGGGTVWMAEDLQLQRQVALKELVPHYAGADPGESRAWALREARAIARVRHPSVVTIHDLFLHDGDPWIVMDYIDGRSLEAIIRERRLEEHAIAAIGLQVLRGLGAAHRAGVVHRDVKPSNILLSDDGSVFLVDFGIARITESEPVTGRQPLVGTLGFIAPERILGQEDGPASDLWSLGATLYCALEGHSPFTPSLPHLAAITAILNRDPPAPARQGRLADVILRMLAKNPAVRASEAEIAQALQSIAAEAQSTEPGAQVPSATAERMRSAQVSLTGQHLDDARQVILEATERVGTEMGAHILRAMPDDQAATILAGIATARPDAAANILRALDPADVGHILEQVPPDKAASVLAAIPARDAAQVLSRLPVRVCAALTMRMQAIKVAEILAYLRPDTVAAILRRLTPAFRAEITRGLPPTRPRHAGEEFSSDR